MVAELIDGKKISKELVESIKLEASGLDVQPGLATVIVGDDPASQTYVRNKHVRAEAAGFYSEDHKLPASTSQDELLTFVDNLNRDDKIHGFIVQLPLPASINPDEVILAINPSKDVDGFHPTNLGKLISGDETLAPATPKGIVYLLEKVTGLEGKDVVIVNRSAIVGKPLSLMLAQRSATVTVCHTKTKDLAGKCAAADIVVSATGRPGFLTAGMVGDGAVVIDVGTTWTDDGLKGDAVFDEVAEKASFITPVPGGVGPMTIAMLLQNTLNAAKK